jgi:hypothetical protein
VETVVHHSVSVSVSTKLSFFCAFCAFSRLTAFSRVIECDEPRRWRPGKIGLGRDSVPAKGRLNLSPTGIVRCIQSSGFLITPKTPFKYHSVLAGNATETRPNPFAQRGRDLSAMFLRAEDAIKISADIRYRRIQPSLRDFCHAELTTRR